MADNPYDGFDYNQYTTQMPVKPQAAPTVVPAAAPASGPAAALMQDPAYLAFLRSSGLATEIASADTARRKAALEMALGLGTENINESGRRERRGIAGSQEARGVFRSGQTLTRTAEQESDQARRRAALELATASDLGDLQSNLLTRIGGYQTTGGEEALNAATRLYKRDEY